MINRIPNIIMIVSMVIIKVFNVCYTPPPPPPPPPRGGGIQKLVCPNSSILAASEMQK